MKEFFANLSDDLIPIIKQFEILGPRYFPVPEVPNLQYSYLSLKSVNFLWMKKSYPHPSTQPQTWEEG